MFSRASGFSRKDWPVEALSAAGSLVEFAAVVLVLQAAAGLDFAVNCPGDNLAENTIGSDRPVAGNQVVGTQAAEIQVAEIQVADVARRRVETVVARAVYIGAVPSWAGMVVEGRTAGETAQQKLLGKPKTYNRISKMQLQKMLAEIEACRFWLLGQTN